MSNPFREAAAKRKAIRRERIREDYVPIVTWVKVPEDVNVTDVRNWLRDQVNGTPTLTAATSDVPYSYATEGTIYPEEADGAADKDK